MGQNRGFHPRGVERSVSPVPWMSVSWTRGPWM